MDPDTVHDADPDPDADPSEDKDAGGESEPAEPIAVQVPVDAALDVAAITRAVAHVLARHGRAARSVSVAVVDDATMADLHQQFMGIAGPTDVLSFNLAENPTDPLDGEIVISFDTARREAERRGHDVQAEVTLYAVHGLLHLLGHDDQTVADAQAMHALEDDCLAELGIGRIYHREAPCD